MCDNYKKEKKILLEFCCHCLFILSQGGSLTAYKKQILDTAYRKTVKKMVKNGIALREELTYRGNFSDNWKWKDIVYSIYDEFYLDMEKY
jgi:hypothetical protein